MIAARASHVAIATAHQTIHYLVHDIRTDNFSDAK